MNKSTGYVVLGVVGVAAFLYLRNQLQASNATTRSRGVTGTQKEGSLSTTPITVGGNKLAYAQPQDVLSLLLNAGGAIKDRVLGSSALPHQDYRTRQGNPVSAQAAWKSPVSTAMSNYRTNPWAPNVRQMAK